MSDKGSSLVENSALDQRRRTHFKPVRPDDAEFILSLRTDPQLNSFLSPVDDSVEAQRRWIESYVAREDRGEEYYYLIMHEGRRAGTVRLYDFQFENGIRSFSWGSWIIPAPRPKGLANVSLCLVYKISFSSLGFNRSHFKVDLRNLKVIELHLRTGAERLADSDGDANFYFWPKEMKSLWARHKEALVEHEQY
ncbi:GNAT family N-acetyltransferase [Parvibaculum sp.]|uniref:GNAT family N-acetyltransferase n=1 Tax=Parvibaculum sp. TaxID=2024848 RepID=UPI00320C3CA9